MADQLVRNINQIFTLNSTIKKIRKIYIGKYSLWKLVWMKDKIDIARMPLVIGLINQGGILTKQQQTNFSIYVDINLCKSQINDTTMIMYVAFAHLTKYAT